MIKSSHIAWAAFTAIATSLTAVLPASAENDSSWMYSPNQGYEHQGYGSDNYRARRYQRRIQRARAREREQVSSSGRQNLGAPPQPGAEKLEGGPQPHISPKSPRTIAFHSAYKRGTIIIDTSRRKLFYVLSKSTAYQYPVSVGRQGFQWSGTNKISRVQAWPSWHPPKEMRERDPRLPKMMTGGIYNPLGAKALYLGNTLYRIHGTNNKNSIGRAASSGCIRMLNSHVMHLASITRIGTTVHVLKKLPGNVARSVRDGKRQS